MAQAADGTAAGAADVLRSVEDLAEVSATLRQLVEHFDC